MAEGLQVVLAHLSESKKQRNFPHGRSLNSETVLESETEDISSHASRNLSTDRTASQRQRPVAPIFQRDWAWRNRRVTGWLCSGEAKILVF